MIRSDAGPTSRADDPFTECAAETTVAETRFQPVDVIWIVDSSGSMRGEADNVQANINAFAGTIGGAMIDYHVVMVSASSFVNVPGPLGTDPSRFLYVEEEVGSNEGLIDLVNRFESYRDFLRPSASTHFVVVTDDESEDMDATTFTTRMQSLLGHDFILHAIASPPGSTHCEPPGFCFVTVNGCEGPDDEAADNGDEYWSVASRTGGERLSICTRDWSALFGTLTAAIAVRTELPCRYVLPAAPDGMALDRMRVNVVYTPSTGTGEAVIPHVDSFSGCSGLGGWYYEDDEIVVCPATCTTLGADAAGQVDIALGCATVLI